MSPPQPPPPTKRILVFGGSQLEDTLLSIQELVRLSKSIPSAKRFLREATDVVQLEFTQLSREDHGWTGNLDSLLALAEEYHETRCDNVIISTVLACVGRLGQLICNAFEDPTILGSALEPVELIAQCDGLLPATVVMAARDTSELFSLSRQIISISYRLGCEIRRRMRLVDSRLECWGRTYAGITGDRMQDILDEFHDSQCIPDLRKVDIGLIYKDHVTIVGPPASLERLESWSADMKDGIQLKTTFMGPIHTRFAPRVDPSQILGQSALLSHPVDLMKARLFSTSSSKPYEHLTLGLLLEEIIEDIMHRTSRVGESIDACLSSMAGRDDIKLTHLGQKDIPNYLKLALRSHSIDFQVNPSLTTTRNEMSRGDSDLVAVVGMSGRFPDNDTVEGFWEDLLAGTCHIKEVPKSRFDLDAFFDEKGEKKNSTSARHGAWLKNPGFFDHRLFNVSPREAGQMDPGHRITLMIAYEALQAAGYSPEGGLANGGTRVATYFGQVADEWREIMNQKGADIYYLPGFSRAFGAGRLNYYFNWTGPSFSLDTACSTSAAAVGLACSALIARESDMALAGGCSILTSPNVFSGLSKGGILSPTGGCRTFHEDADGYARGEGVGVVVLKRLEDALSDNDNILAVIRGAAKTSSPMASSITHPSVVAQRATYDEVLRQAGLRADEIAYVEMHGTGTQAGDVEEMCSTVKSMAKERQEDNPLTVGAVKAAVGHGEGAAGVTSLIKTIMMLKERKVPPQPNWPFELNRNFPSLGELNVKIATEATVLKPSPRGDQKLKMLVNSFDAAGGNVTIAIEEPPLASPKTVDSRPWHVVAISARTPASLQNNRARLLEFLEKHPETMLCDLAYTTTARRIHEPLRCAYSGESTESIIYQLRQDVAKQLEVPKTKPKKCSRIFLFTGQGSHFAGMGAGLFKHCTMFRETLLCYQDMATMMGFPRFIDLISDPGDDVQSHSTVTIQLSIVALEIALAHVMKIWGITPDAVIGHSLGEYAALCVAGVLSVSDTLFLVGNRASLMEENLTPNSYSMLASSVEEQALVQLFFDLGLDSCSIACVNAPTITVSSGTLRDINRLEQHLKNQGQKTTMLRVPYGFHSRQIEPILEKLQRCAEGVVFSKPQIQVVSTLTGQVEKSTGTFSPEYIARQARGKVNFSKALESCRASGISGEGSLWFEIGPDPVCLGLARKTIDIPAANALPLLRSGDDNWRTISHTLKRVYQSGNPVNWHDFHKPFKGCLTLLSLPSYAFDTRDFWTPYTKPAPIVEVAEVTPTETVRKIPGFPTNSLQRVEEENIDGESISVVFTSLVSDSHLYETIRGHEVNGRLICPLGVFHDMALTAANYIYHTLHEEAGLPCMSVRGIELSQALIVNAASLDTIIRVSSSHHIAGNIVNIQFHSKKDDTLTFHGKCEVLFNKDVAMSVGASQTFLLKSRVSSLQGQATLGTAHRLLKPVVYQLFSGVVAYSSSYHTLQEVILDAGCNDAVATVKLPDVSNFGQHQLSPYWADACVQLAGFVLNSGLRYSHEYANLCTGFESWQPIVNLSAEKTYTVYVCMQDLPNSHTVTGDCFIFCEDELVQATLGIKFLRIKKSALSAILGGAGPSKPQAMVQRSQSNAKQINTGISTPGKYNDTKSQIYEMPRRLGPLVTIPSNTAPSQMSKRATTSPSTETDMLTSVLAIAATESGCSLEEMGNDTRYVDLGIDSVMAISILAEINRQLNLDLPAAFFLENETIGESRVALQKLINPGNAEISPESTVNRESESRSSPAQYREMSPVLFSPGPYDTSPSSFTPTPTSILGDEGANKLTTGKYYLTPAPAPKSKLLGKAIQYQGSRSGNMAKLFFMADETGSTFGYIQLPQLGPSLGVYGIEVPLTSDIDIDFYSLVDVYLSTLLSEQPDGPYILSGISAGAVIAFEVVRRLLEAGHDVLGLILIDCASPKAPGVVAQKANGITSCDTWYVKASQGQKLGSLTSLFATYEPKPIPRLKPSGFCLQILAEAHSEEFETGLTWTDLVPGLDTLRTDIKQGSFLTSSMVNRLGQLCADVVGNIRG